MLAGFLLVANGCAGSSPRIEAANIVFVLIDTLRADHLGAYGYPRPTSPSIDRLAARGIVFEQARSVAPWTNPTIAALFTGRHPRANFEPQKYGRAIRQILPASVPTLAEKLQRAGLRTAAFVDHPGISVPLGYGRGFETFVSLFKSPGSPGFTETPGKLVVERVAAQLPAIAAQRYFLYTHLIYPHQPYQAPAPFDGQFGPTRKTGRQDERAQLVNAYDAEIRYADDVVDQLLAKLESSGMLENAWIVLTADHGEGFWEHGLPEHGNSFYDELLHVPLILVPPRGARLEPRRIATPVSLVDVHPTILELAGAAPETDPGQPEGRSLLRFLRAQSVASSAGIFFESPHSGDVHATAILAGSWKLIRWHQAGRPRAELYDLATDPGETRNLATSERRLLRRLDSDLDSHLARDQEAFAKIRSASQAGELDDETVARLRALGYLD